VAVSDHWAFGNDVPMVAAIAGTSGAPRLLMTATTVPTKISTATRERDERATATVRGSQVVALINRRVGQQGRVHTAPGRNRATVTDAAH
jgi:hypothetical protein